jgi:hypothetical protein
MNERAPRGGARKLIAVSGAALLLASFPGSASAHNYDARQRPHFGQGIAKPACPAGGDSTTINAASKWPTAPLNGYVELRIQRQAVADNGDIVVTQQRTTNYKNTTLEGNRTDLHWKVWTPAAGMRQNGYQTRVTWAFRFKKDDFARDTLVKKLVIATNWCIQPDF